MKKTFSMLLLLILTLSICCAHAEENDAQIADHSVAAIQQRGTLRVAVQSGNSKMSYRVPEGIEEYADRAGQPSGYVPFLCRQLAEDLGVTLEFVFYDLTEQQIAAAENNEADISANVWSITEERLERFTMTDNILVTGIEGDEVFLRADPQRPGSPLIDSEEALAEARIAAVKSTVQVDNTRLQYSRSGCHRLCRQRRRAGRAAVRRGRRRSVYDVRQGVCRHPRPSHHRPADLSMRL